MIEPASEAPPFVAKLRAFSAHLRDPQKHAPPADLDPKRLAVYQNAVYANVEQFLSDNFPRVKALFDDDAWKTLVRDYIVNHESNTVVFVELPLEFLRYLEHVRDIESDPDFLYELAHFEWLETLVSADSERIDSSDIDPEGDLMAGVPVINPVARLVKYTYPVHLIDADNTLDNPPSQPTYIVAFRRRDNKFGFLDLNAPAARLIELVGAGDGRTGEELLAEIAAQLGVAEPRDLHDPGMEMFERLRRNDVILGTRRATT